MGNRRRTGTIWRLGSLRISPASRAMPKHSDFGAAHDAVHAVLARLEEVLNHRDAAFPAEDLMTARVRTHGSAALAADNAALLFRAHWLVWLMIEQFQQLLDSI